MEEISWRALHFFITFLIFWAFPLGESFSPNLDILSLQQVLHCRCTNLYLSHGKTAFPHEFDIVL